MLLLSHRIGLAHPAGELLIKLRATVQTKRVQVVSRREGFYARKARVIEPAREHEVTYQVITAHRNRDERHPDLEGDPGFLRQNLYRTALLDHRGQGVEQLAHLLTLADEMRFEANVATRMTLVAVGEASATLRTLPKR